MKRGWQSPMDFRYEREEGRGRRWMFEDEVDDGTVPACTAMDLDLDEKIESREVVPKREEKMAPLEAAPLQIAPAQIATEATERKSAPLEPLLDPPHSPSPHPLLRKDTPFILSGYLNLFFSASILSSILYILLKTIITLSSDIKARSDEHAHLERQLKSDCQRHYLVNGCASQPPPALQSLCREWQVCLENISSVGQARVAAEIMAEVVNSFIEPISLKSFFFFLVLLLGSMAMTNMTYSAIRGQGDRDGGEVVQR